MIESRSVATETRLQPNPFSTRFTRPGAIPYLFEDGATAEEYASRFIRQGLRGQIIGPHGSGKSTFVASLLDPLSEAGYNPIVFALHDRQRRVPRGWQAAARGRSSAIIAIDGYEQLSSWSRYRVRFACRRHGWGLLVTAHADAGLPTLFQAQGTLATVEKIVTRLLGDHLSRIDRAAVARSFALADGNVRETLMALFDEFEFRMHAAPDCADCSG